MANLSISQRPVTSPAVSTNAPAANVPAARPDLGAVNEAARIAAQALTGAKPPAALHNAPAIVAAGASAAQVVSATTSTVPKRTFAEAVEFLAGDRSVAMLIASNGTKLGLESTALPALTATAEKVCRFFARGARFNLVGGGDQLQSDVLKYDVSNARAELRAALHDLNADMLAFQADKVEGTAYDVTSENGAGVCYVPSLTKAGVPARDAGEVVWGGRSVVDGKEVLHGATWGYLNADLTSALDCRGPVTKAELERALNGKAVGLPRYGVIAYGGGAITAEEVSIALERGMVAFFMPADPRLQSRDKSGAIVDNPAITSPGFRGDAAVAIAAKIASGEWIKVPATALGVAEADGFFVVRA